MYGKDILGIGYIYYIILIVYYLFKKISKSIPWLESGPYTFWLNTKFCYLLFGFDIQKKPGF